MRILRTLVTTLVAAAVLLGVGLGAGYALHGRDGGTTGTTDPAARTAAGGPAYDPVADAPTSAPASAPSTAPTRTPSPSASPTPTRTRAPLTAGPALLERGDEGEAVRDVQARLVQLQWFFGTVDGDYGDATAEAVEGFQAKRGFPVTGEVDRRTRDRLVAMTREPTRAELHGLGTDPGPLDARCRTGRVLCIDKTSSTLRWVVDGTVRTTLAVRFGAETTPTREGAFHVERKSRDHVSTLYGSKMPYAMFFSRGQAVHYSSDFAARGYAGASHGCVNVRDEKALAALFDQVEVGDDVVVYRS